MEGGRKLDRAHFTSLFYFECALCQVELDPPPLLFSVDLLLFKVFFQVKTNKNKGNEATFVFFLMI